ncbi:MAG: copper amine oxidase N-terminal domain-containing protein, partial [Clostridia bacterium]|nr:copper amine oxidase N-terminal domain-containing protein [Clostridia bacterium]
MKKKTIPFGKSLLLFTLIFAFLSTLPLSSSALSLSPKTITDVRTEKYTPVPLYAGKTRLRTDGRIMGGTTFIPARVFFDTLYPGVQITYQKSNRTLTVTGKNLSVSMTDGSRVLYANGRVLYTDTPMVILSDGRLYAPVHLLSKVLSL